jgi:hypothetical protein
MSSLIFYNKKPVLFSKKVFETTRYADEVYFDE